MMRDSQQPGEVRVVESGMQRTLQIARAAARRRMLRRLMTVLGPAMVVASGLALIVLLTDRLIGPGIDWWLVVGPAAAAGLLASLAATFIRPGTVLEAAVEVDTALVLKDRLGTALALARAGNGGAPSDPFVAMAVEDAERIAATADARRAVPIRLGRSWSAWPVMMLAAALLGVLMQPMHLLAARTGPGRISITPEQVTRAQEDLRKTADALKEPEDPTKPEEPLSTEAQRLLEKLNEELTQGKMTPDEARLLAASQMEQEAEALARENESSAARDEALKEALAEAAGAAGGEAADGGEPGEQFGDPLTEALEQGDMEAASKAAEELAKAIEAEQLTDEQLTEMAEALEQMAQSLEQSAAEQERLAREQAERQMERLQQQGFSKEDAQKMMQETDPAALEKMMRERGMDEQSAQKMAQEMAQENRQRQAREQAAQEQQRLCQGMRDAASECRGNCKGGAQGQRPGSASGQRSGQKGSAPQSVPSLGQPSAAQKLQQMLDQMAGRQRDAAGDAVRIARMKGEAQRLMNSLSMSERQRRDGWGSAQRLQGGGRQAGSGGSENPLLDQPPIDHTTAPVDVRRTGEGPQQVAGEFTRPDSLKRAPRTGTAPTTQELRQAQRSAEQAIEEQSVPARYRNVREYFKKAVKRAETEDSKKTDQPPAPSAPDAGPKKDEAAPAKQQEPADKPG